MLLRAGQKYDYISQKHRVKRRGREGGKKVLQRIYVCPVEKVMDELTARQPMDGREMKFYDPSEDVSRSDKSGYIIESVKRWTAGRRWRGRIIHGWWWWW